MKYFATLAGRPRKVAVAVLAAALLLAGAAVPVYAQGPTPLPRGLAVVERILSRLYEREQAWLGLQTNHLARAAQAADKAQQLLDAAKEKGRDVTALEQALAAFRAGVAQAQAAHDQAASILGTHTGFDASGQVTDRQAARQTVVRARQSLAEAHRILLRAVRDLRRAVRDWRRSQRLQAPAASS
jgi:hypothetical protein